MNANTIHVSVKLIALCDSNVNIVKNHLKTRCLLSDKDFIKQMEPEMAEGFFPPQSRNSVMPSLIMPNYNIHINRKNC